MPKEACDVCKETDEDWYYDCEKCNRHLCERCYGDITLTVCRECLKGE